MKVECNNKGCRNEDYDVGTEMKCVDMTISNNDGICLRYVCPECNNDIFIEINVKVNK